MSVVKDYPPYLDYPKPPKIMTNADRIRAMSDEELARWMLRYQRQIIKETLRTLGTEEHVKAFEEALGENPDCTDIVRWLKQPVEDK